MKAVVKVGGSLQGSGYLEEVCEVLDGCSDRNSLVIVPGGGRFADFVREFQEEHGLSDEIAHRMAIKGMEVFGLGLEELTSEFFLTEDLGIAKDGGVIFLPSDALEHQSSLESSWRVTSDSISAWLCRELGFSNLILVKRVDGIRSNGLLSQVTIEELKSMGQVVVDSKFPDILKESDFNCWIVNGEHPERIESVLQKREFKGTKIV